MRAIGFTPTVPARAVVQAVADGDEIEPFPDFRDELL